MKLLLVQDEQASRILATFLGKLGHQVETCVAGEAVAGCQGHDADVALLDLPPAPTLEVCRRIRTNPATSAVPVIVFSARPTREQVLQAVQAGASNFIDKGSMSVAVVQEKIEKVCKGGAAPGAAPPRSAPAAPPPGLKVVLISPKKHLGLLLRREMKSFDLVVASYSEQLFQQILAAPPDVVLIDDALKDALKLAGAFSKRLDGLGLVLISRQMTRDKVVGAARAGVSSIVVQPFSPAMLLGAVRQAFGKAGNATARARVPDLSIEAGLGGMPEGDAILQRMIEVDSVKSLPHIIERALFITDDATAGATELEEVILSDANASAVLLRRVNSAYYAGEHEITRVRDAITRMGFQEVKSLVMTLSVIENFGVGQEQLGFDRLGFWKASLATAVVARELAYFAGLKAGEEAFLGGLLADFGKMLLDEHLRDRFEQAISLSHERVVRLAEAERRVIGSDHNQVACAVLEKWGFPARIVEVIGRHEMLEWPAEAPRQAWLPPIVGLAKWIVQTLGVGDSSEILFEYPPAEVQARVDLGRFLDEALIERIRDEVGGMLSYFKVALDWPPVPPGEQQPMHYLETAPLPLSPLALVIRRAGGKPLRLDGPQALSQLEPRAVALAHFGSAGALKEAAAGTDWGERPWLFLLPRGQIPADDAIKARVGLPVGACRYTDHPCSLRELSTTLAGLGA